MGGSDTQGDQLDLQLVFGLFHSFVPLAFSTTEDPLG